MADYQTTQRQRDRSDESGFVLVWAAVFMTLLLFFLGLALDTARAYVVKAQLAKAADGAALAAARMLNSGEPRVEAARIFRANFPEGYLGTETVTDPVTDPDFFDLETNVDTGVHVVTIRATATLPTTFMRLANREEVTVRSTSESTRRMVDLSLVLDVSGSIGADWPTVRDAAREFVRGFDEEGDRFAFITFSSGASVRTPMTVSRGFNKDGILAAIPETLPGGLTNMAEGFFRGWDEVRTVPTGQQSGVRVIVLFTDGSPNGASGLYANSAGDLFMPVKGRSLHTGDFGPSTTNTNLQGLHDTETGTQSPSHTISVSWRGRTTISQIPFMPEAASFTHHRSDGIPSSFGFQSGSLTVDGVAQSSARGLRDYNTVKGRYPAQAFNVNNAARNLVEIVANAARSDDDGDYPIRVYTIGMGPLMVQDLGTRGETSESILMRVANDIRSMDFNAGQLEGRFYLARSADDVAPAFQTLQSQIIRLTR
ncbi:MAG: VWA domain-containing protein [Acidobacteria bacterium]|nr:VWA domain-containing protein [Acidobacteriota bacterium]